MASTAFVTVHGRHNGRFVDAIRGSTQDPFGGSMHFLEELGYLYTGDAHVFSVFAHGDEDLRPDFREALFRSERFGADERSQYERLSDSDKESVLGFETLLLHELTHQIDTLTTPLAALIHMWQVEEFLRLAPILESLAARSTLDISAPLARCVVVPDHPVRAALRADGHLEAFEQLLAYTTQLRPFDGIAAADVTPGWDGNVGRIQLFGEAFDAVTVFADLHTIRRPGARRPVTLQSVLETHALANCVRHILWRFQDDTATAAREMSRYIHCFYPAGIGDDYRFLFDALARLNGSADYPELLSRQAGKSITLLDQIPVLAGLLAWAALHSAQPTERLILASDYLHTAITTRVEFTSPLDVLNHLDQQAGLEPRADDALKMSRQLTREQRQRVPEQPAGVASHFVTMLDGVHDELTTRIERGFGLGDPVGTPNNGNPARYLAREQVDRFGGMYDPDPAYDRWRALRTSILARRRPAAEKHAAIREWLTTAA